MLKKLSISNYAIIDELTVQFEKGLNIITGETGAGKSILIGALNLVLGARADSTVLYNKERKCFVEALFYINLDEPLMAFLKENDLDAEPEILLRREISANGKSRSFINDTPANLSQLRNLSSLLVDLHQQFDTLELNNDSFQLQVMDAFAGNASQLKGLKAAFTHSEFLRKELEQLQLNQDTAKKEFDYNQFLFDELEKLAFKEGEIELLEEEMNLLANAETISQQLNAVIYELEDAEQPLLSQLKTIQNKLQNLGGLVPSVQELIERMNICLVELRDVSQEVKHINLRVHSNPTRKEEIDERISAGYKLFRKHNVTTTNELLDIQNQLSQKLEAVNNLESQIEVLTKQRDIAYEQALKIAEEISVKRNGQTKPFSKKVNELLKQVGMPNASLVIDIKRMNLCASGIDSISFLFDANKSGRAEPIGKVASGGELSRLMLCIKSLVAKQLQLPTLIFDEIDSGISGEAARQVGIIMSDLSVNHQLIAITHQPQIAARAGTHYFVYKENLKNRIVTGIRVLGKEERILAIAKMLGGEKPSAIAMENAREMISN